MDEKQDTFRPYRRNQMKCYWLLNHACNENQLRELMYRFHVDEIVYPSTELASFWAALPCDDAIHTPLIDEWVDSIRSDDMAVIQGDVTYVFYAVSALIAKGVKVYSAVSARVVEETVVGDVTTMVRQFRHITFRQYRGLSSASPHPCNNASSIFCDKSQLSCELDKVSSRKDGRRTSGACLEED